MHTKLRSRLRRSHLRCDISTENIVRECHSACASVVLDDGRACATVDLGKGAPLVYFCAYLHLRAFGRRHFMVVDLDFSRRHLVETLVDDV